MNVPDLDRWTPIRLDWVNDKPTLTWLPLGARRFTEPFFEQTIGAAMRRPAPLLFQQTTPAAALAAFADRAPPPAGFVFHMSRCGSTLVSQVLAAVPAHRVISEAALIDTVLGARVRDPRLTHEEHLAWFRGVIHALGHGRAGERRSFFKFDPAHTLHLPFIREAFPGVPWIFIYRDPVEVLVSQHRQRGSQMIPGMIDPRRLGLSPENVRTLSFDAYTAQVLALACSAVLTFDHGQLNGGRLVHYRELPDAIWETLADFFGLKLSNDELAHMRAAATFSGKNPALPHTDDTTQKQRSAPAELRTLAAHWLAGPYERLERLRDVRLG